MTLNTEREAGADVPGDAQIDPQRVIMCMRRWSGESLESPQRSRKDVTVCMRGRTVYRKTDAQRRSHSIQ